jgi:hypothetical protein
MPIAGGRRTPRPWTFFSVSRQVSWLAGRCGFFVFPAKASDVMAKQLAADSCGGSAGFPHRVRFTGFPLSH